MILVDIGRYWVNIPSHSFLTPPLIFANYLALGAFELTLWPNYLKKKL